MEIGFALLKKSNMNNDIQIRDITPADNFKLAQIIRASLEEFGAAKPGTVYFDETTDHLSDSFKVMGSRYFIVTIHGELVGGGGIYPTENLPKGTCELVKLYLASKARGQGLGKMLMQKCELAAMDLGYINIYLETMPELNVAVPLYQKMHYQYLEAPLGNSGHSGCNIWMLKRLQVSGCSYDKK
jgi:putative acetyltransferase